MSGRAVEIIRNTLLVSGVLASIVGLCIGANVWLSEKSPQELRKEQEYRRILNVGREAAARADGRVATSNELDHMDDLNEVRWSGSTIVFVSAGGLILTLVLASVLSASAHILRSKPPDVGR